jgi:hypothetical protein
VAINRLNPDYPDAGIVQLLPSSVAVGSGSGSVGGNGQVSFSGASSVSLNDVFSATYDNYQLVFKNTSTTANNVRCRLRVGGSDNSTASSYTTQIIRGASSTASALNLVEAQWDFYSGNTSKSTMIIHLSDPFLTAETSFAGVGGRSDRAQGLTGFHNQTVSYTGFTILCDAGTITGTVSVYGYRN